MFDSVAPNLPVLQTVLEFYNAARRQPLRGMKVLSTQHLLGSTLSLFHALEVCGVAPHDITIVVKAYSSNAAALIEARSRGYYIFGGGPMLSDALPYEEVLEQSIFEAGKHALDKMEWASKPGAGGRNILVIDDGGRMLDTLFRNYPGVSSFACGVEQTTRGIRDLAGQTLCIPVANVGRCRAKLEVEADLIAKSMVENLDIEVASSARVAGLFGRKLLLVGFGAVGECLAPALRARSYDVAVVDSDEDHASKACAAGFPILALPSALIGRDIICGATGFPWFLPEWVDLVEPGALLVNMASSDIEFGAWKLRAAGEPVPTSASRSTPWEVLYRLEGARGLAWLAKGGFPINFTGGIDPIDPKKIQLTRALLLVGALEAASARDPGLFSLPDHIQQLIMDDLG